jgi:hypothetical protein
MATDNYLADKIKAGNVLIESGKMVWVKEYTSDLKLFFPILEQAKGFRRNGYRELTEWGEVHRENYGFFSIDRPVGIPAQPNISILKGKIDGEVVVIPLPFDLHERYGAKEIVIAIPPNVSDYHIIEHVNKELSNDGFPICTTDIEGSIKMPSFLRFATDDVVVPLLNAVVDRGVNQVVAMSVIATDTQTIQAIKATLATNSKKQIKVMNDQETYWLSNAQRGYKAISTSLGKRNIKGSVYTFVHPLAIKPEDGEPFWWLLTLPGDDLNEKFGRIFPYATKWPIKPEWAPYLLKEGITATIVRKALTLGYGFNECYTILDTARYEDDPGHRKNWKYIISNGLKEGHITI